MNLDLQPYLLFVVGFLGSMACYVTVSRLLAPPAAADAADLSALAARPVGTTSAFSSLNPHGDFLDQLDLFLLRTFHLDVRLEELHMLMGRPSHPTPLRMLRYKEIGALVFGAGAVLATGEWFLALLALLGFLIPDLLYSARIRARQAVIMRNFPTAVDLLALTIEAGLDYMSAIERILKNVPAAQRTELEKELEKTLNEVALGYSRRDALKRLALRTGLPEVRSFVGLIVQSDELGTSLVDLLRNYAADLRFRRLNRAEKLAAKASTKMLFPLFIFIFPTVFILMLAPLARSLFQGGLGF
ncbi:MAG: type II secretion system F family protein [Elusimicrobia bacterium]|nr:type II secretion system F family protein [Elusimicrobiota bacterium]